jgi:hypothetical protein
MEKTILTKRMGIIDMEMLVKIKNIFVSVVEKQKRVEKENDVGLVDKKKN